MIYNDLNNSSIDVANIIGVRPSQVSLELVKQYLSIEKDYTKQDILLNMCIVSSIDYVCKYSGKTIEELDKYIYMTIPILMIICNSYENNGVIAKDNNIIIDKYLNLISDINI